MGLFRLDAQINIDIFSSKRLRRGLAAAQKHPCRWSGISSFIAPNGDQRWFDMRSFGQLFKNWWVDTSSRMFHWLMRIVWEELCMKNGYFCQSFTSHWGYWPVIPFGQTSGDQIHSPFIPSIPYFSSLRILFIPFVTKRIPRLTHIDDIFKARKSSEILVHQLLCMGSQRVVSSPNSWQDARWSPCSLDDHPWCLWKNFHDCAVDASLHVELPLERFNMGIQLHSSAN